MKAEWTARIVLFLLLASAAGFIGFAAAPALGLISSDTLEIHARMPENGGWSTETIHATAGQPIHLRLTSDDVLHSFAIGQADGDPTPPAPLELVPGEWHETTLVFDKPGRYTFYCTRWCGRNHWRMRGTIIVDPAADAAQVEAQPTFEKPLYLQLGLDVDAPHTAAVVPSGPTSAERGAKLAQAKLARLPAWALDRQTYQTTAPAELFARLRAEPGLKDLSDAQVWDVLAYLQSRQTTPEKLAEAKQLYSTNCAACHGEAGKGDGVMVEGLPRFDPAQIHPNGASTASAHADRASGMTGSDANMTGEMNLSAPPDFSDPHVLLGASPALLQGKLLRGGMGTGMPYWGPIFTTDQMDAIIAYLYTFAQSNHP